MRPGSIQTRALSISLPEDEHGGANCGGCTDACPQNPQHHPRSPASWSAPHEPGLIHERRDRKEREQRLKTLEPHGAARADHRHGAKSCQDLRKHSSTRHQQGRNHRKDSGRLRLEVFHCGACGRVTAGHGAFTAVMHTLR